MTHNKFIEVMQVPVLSTAHLPSNEAIEASELLIAPYEGGWFVSLDYGIQDDPQWFEPIRDWAIRICPTANWVRFDMDAERTCELKEYEW